MSTID